MSDEIDPIDLGEVDFGPTLRGFRPGDSVFGRFLLKKQIGRGGMGVVWLAQDQRLDNREVALKFMPEIVRYDPAAVDELKEETKRGLDLAHPSIVRVYDFITDDESAALSMEYVDGETLARLRIRQPSKVFEVSTLLPWVRQMIGALHYAHTEAEVVHRDLKPANLMIDRNNRLKITDFGIARSISDSVARQTYGNSAGTLAYMSPQQAGGSMAAVSDDIYSFGATLYELLTGKPPFYTGDVRQQLYNQKPPSVEERRFQFGVEGEAIPPEWEQALQACLEKDAGHRPPNIDAVAEMLGMGDGLSRGLGDATSMSRPVLTRSNLEATGDPQTVMPAPSDTMAPPPLHPQPQMQMPVPPHAQGPGQGQAPASEGDNLHQTQHTTGGQPTTSDATLGNVTAVSGTLRPVMHTGSTTTSASSSKSVPPPPPGTLPASKKKKSYAGLVVGLVVGLLLLGGLGAAGVMFGPKLAKQYLGLDLSFGGSGSTSTNTNTTGGGGSGTGTPPAGDRTQAELRSLILAAEGTGQADEARQLLKDYKKQFGADSFYDEHLLKAEGSGGGFELVSGITDNDPSETPGAGSDAGPEMPANPGSGSGNGTVAEANANAGGATGPDTETTTTIETPGGGDTPAASGNENTMASLSGNVVPDAKSLPGGGEGPPATPGPGTGTDVGNTSTSPDTDTSRPGGGMGAVGGNANRVTVPDDFETVQEALAKVPDGGVILLKAGDYDESIEIKKSVQLVGETPGQVRISYDGQSASVLSIQGAKNVVLRDLILEHAGDEGRGDGPPVVGIVSSEVTIENCSVRNAMAQGMRISDDSDVKIQRSQFVGNTTQGILVETASKLEFVDNEVRQNGENGLCVVSRGTTASVQGGSFSRNGQNGILFEDAGRGTVSNAAAEDNGQAGVAIAGEASTAAVAGTACRRNNAGIVITQGAGATLESNVCERNDKFGIYADDPGLDLKLTDNTCQSQPSHGVALIVRPGVPVSVVGGKVNGNGQSGIFVVNRQTMNVADGGNAQQSANASEAPMLMLEIVDNVFENNGFAGIELLEKVGGLVRGNRCLNNRQYGISIGAHSAPRVESNEFAGSPTPIHQEPGASPNLTSNTERPSESGQTPAPVPAPEGDTAPPVVKTPAMPVAPTATPAGVPVEAPAQGGSATKGANPNPKLPAVNSGNVPVITLPPKEGE